MQKILWTGIHKVLFKKLLAGLHRYRDYSRSQCLKRIEQGSSQSDVFDTLHSAQNTLTKEPLFSPLELQSETSLLIIAGSDTTATCLAATIFYLLHNPRSLERAQQEVRHIFPTLEELESGSQLKECQYLRACIDESLRMSPPVGGLMPRETLTGGMIVDGEHIPEGVEIGTPIYAIHHSEIYYPDPFRFDPGRWLTSADNAPRKGLLGEDAFCAFSVGSRSCIGKSFAYQEMMCVLSTLLWKFGIRLAPGSRLGEGHDSLGQGRTRSDEFQLYDVFASKCAGPFVEFRERDF